MYVSGVVGSETMGIHMENQSLVQKQYEIIGGWTTIGGAEFRPSTVCCSFLNMGFSKTEISENLQIFGNRFKKWSKFKVAFSEVNQKMQSKWSRKIGKYFKN